jgi:large subunit ribosomal protein L15
VRRVPKFGFTNPTRVEYKGINLDTLQTLAASKGLKAIDPEVLYTNGLIARNDKLQVLGRGDLKNAIEIKAHAFSASARTAIENAGGKAEVIEKKMAGKEEKKN